MIPILSGFPSDTAPAAARRTAIHAPIPGVYRSLVTLVGSSGTKIGDDGSAPGTAHRSAAREAATRLHGERRGTRPGGGVVQDPPGSAAGGSRAHRHQARMRARRV